MSPLPMPVVEVPAAPLSYARTDMLPQLLRPWRTVAMRIVLICWALPLAAGIVIFIAAMATRVGRGRPFDDSALAYAGLWNIAIGVCLSGVGGIAVLVFMAGRWARAVGDRWGLVVSPAIGAILVLASNYLVAFVMVYICVN